MRQKQGEPYLSITDEAFKMAYTDAISNAAKALGCGADIWFDKDRTKYDLQQERAQAAPQSAPAQPDNDMVLLQLIAKINACKTADEVTAIWNSNPTYKSDVRFKDAVATRGKALKGGAA